MIRPGLVLAIIGMFLAGWSVVEGAWMDALLVTALSIFLFVQDIQRLKKETITISFNARGGGKTKAYEEALSRIRKLKETSDYAQPLQVIHHPYKLIGETVSVHKFPKMDTGQSSWTCRLLGHRSTRWMWIGPYNWMGTSRQHECTPVAWKECTRCHAMLVEWWADLETRAGEKDGFLEDWAKRPISTGPTKGIA